MLKDVSERSSGSMFILTAADHVCNWCRDQRQHGFRRENERSIRRHKESPERYHESHALNGRTNRHWLANLAWFLRLLDSALLLCMGVLRQVLVEPFADQTRQVMLHDGMDASAGNIHAGNAAQSDNQTYHHSARMTRPRSCNEEALSLPGN